MFDQVRIVLVNTSHPGNIGGVARAMKNMGLSDLYLVDPIDFPSTHADARASGATDVLRNAHVCKTLDEAIGDVQVVVGASARSRHIPWPLMSPRETAAKTRQSIEAGNKVALVFGREDAGLTNEELQRCTAHVHIPTNPDFSSLNLAAAVQVLAYETRIALLEAQETKENEDPKACETQGGIASKWGTDWDYELVTREELERFFVHLEQTLIDIEFLDPNNPKQLMARMRRLYQRAVPDQMEVNILRGMLSATQKKAK